MKTMNISPLSLVLLLSFITQQEIQAAASDRSDDQQGATPHLDPSPTAYRSNGSLPIPPQAHYQPPAAGSYPPSYSTDDRRGPEGRTPSLGYYSDPGLSPHLQFPLSPGGYAYPPHHPAYGYPHNHPYATQAGPFGHQPAPAGYLASLPPADTAKGHRRQRSNTFNLGDLSLTTGADSQDEVKELPVPRQLQDSFEILTTERDLLITAAQTFLRTTKKESRSAIEGFNENTTGDDSPGEKRRDSTFERLAKGLRSADKNAALGHAKKCRELEQKKEPYQERFLYLAAQCTVMKNALEEATRKLAPTIADGAQPK